MSRTRPIKLHMKDGKEANFRLIGPKGKVLNLLKWDGSTLNLADATDMAESTETVPNNDDNVEQNVPETVVETDDKTETDVLDELNSDAEAENNLESINAPPAVAEPPLPKEDTPSEDEAPSEIEHVSGEPESAGITDEVLDEILNDESKPGKDDEPPIKVDANIPNNPKEPSGWLVKGKDKIAIIAMDDESDDDAIKRVQKKHPGYELHRGPKEPEADSDDKDTDESPVDNSEKKEGEG